MEEFIESVADAVLCRSGFMRIVYVIATFLAICLWSYYPFSQMTDSLPLEVILFLTLWIGNVIGVWILLIGIVILICSE